MALLPTCLAACPEVLTQVTLCRCIPCPWEQIAQRLPPAIHTCLPAITACLPPCLPPSHPTPLPYTHGCLYHTCQPPVQGGGWVNLAG